VASESSRSASDCTTKKEKIQSDPVRVIVKQLFKTRIKPEQIIATAKKSSKKVSNQQLTATEIVMQNNAALEGVKYWDFLKPFGHSTNPDVLVALIGEAVKASKTCTPELVTKQLAKMFNTQKSNQYTDTHSSSTEKSVASVGKKVEQRRLRVRRNAGGAMKGGERLVLVVCQLTHHRLSVSFCLALPSALAAVAVLPIRKRIVVESCSPI